MLIECLNHLNNDVSVQTYDEYNQSVNFESENFIEFYQLQVTFHKHIS